MGKLFRLGIVAGIVGGAVYAWKKMTGNAGSYGERAADDAGAGEQKKDSRQGS